MEVWRPVQRALGYEVSDAGRVRSVDRIVPCRSRWGTVSTKQVRGRVLKPWTDGSDYPMVYLCTVETPRNAVNVHKVVAEAFVEPVPGKEFVNHKDGVKANCAATNLEWCTRVENMEHAYDTGLCPARRPVLAIADGQPRRFESTRAAALALSARAGNIRQALCGQKPTAYGYSWQYA